MPQKPQVHVYGDPCCACERCNGRNPTYGGPVRTAAEFLAAFPAIKTNYGTGGNCTAWYLDLSHAKTSAWFGVIITKIEEPHQPDMTDRKADFGLVIEGEGVEPRVLTWAQAVHWLNGVIDTRDHLTRWAP